MVELMLANSQQCGCGPNQRRTKAALLMHCRHSLIHSMLHHGCGPNQRRTIGQFFWLS